MSTVSFEKILGLISLAIPLLPISIYFYKFKQVRAFLHLRLVICTLIVSFSLDCLSSYFSSKRIHNTFLFNLQDLLQFLLLSWFYYDIVSDKEDADSKSLTKAIFTSAITLYLLILLAVSLLLQNPITQHQNFMWTVSGLILIIYGFMYYHDLVITLPLRKQMNIDSLFLINAGFLYYFSFTLILFLLEEFMLRNLQPETYRLIWSYNNLNNIIKNLLIAIGLAFFPVSENRV